MSLFRKKSNCYAQALEVSVTVSIVFKRKNSGYQIFVENTFLQEQNQGKNIYLQKCFKPCISIPLNMRLRRPRSAATMVSVVFSDKNT